ncbi:heavy metal-binding domain-containing protein [Parasediminibacterium paludis]|uniref:Heavy metal-binding domain-containing protein n=1 Tax=Parasediminibacterium paludis TaxID=908966 RepID=A0ABV8PZ66_9BACT
MSTNFKISLTVLAFGAITFFTACNSSETKTTSTDTTKKETAHEGGDHIYACPMHPEVTGKEGDKCPKCGMALEHNDNAGGPSNVSMLFTATPTSAKANEEVTLSMVPKLKDKPTEQVPLDVEHTKKIHLIVVSEDLSWFDHIHPELNADGAYIVKEKFPFAGKYSLFADYKPSGANHTVDNLNVTISGTVPAAKKYDTDKLTGSGGDGFSVSLSPEGGKFLTNMPMHINGVMMLNGKEVDVNTLEDYLGAKAHMVVVSLADKKYLHVHPSVEGGKFDLHTTFDKPGIYRGWIQYQSKGKVHTSDFVMNVAEGTSANMKDMKHDTMANMKDMKH